MDVWVFTDKIFGYEENMKNKEEIHILHLSDLHFSKNVEEDMDVKVPILLNTKSEKIDKFKEYIKGLPVKPDYVVVSGDITTKGESDGFEIFNEIVVELIKKGRLPSVDKFIIVPGNHDVKAGVSIKDIQRWDNFKRLIGNKYLVPWIVGVDSKYDNMIALVDKIFSDSSPIQGGIVQDLSTGERNSIPFLLDRERKVLFYAFNSSLLSHTKLNDEIANEIISFVKNYRNEEKDLMDLVKKFEREMTIDPARIIGDEIKLFTYCMGKIKELLQDDYKNFLKIAVLHHHVAPIACSEEIKKFELLINAGIFKRTLVDYEFNVVLHGHKHWNEIYWDTAISGGGALLVVSGGTICGMPSKNKKAGFYLLDFFVGEKIVVTHYYEMQDSYRNIIDIKDDKVFSFDTINKNIGLIYDIRSFNVLDLFSRVEHALLRNINCREFQEDKLYGWSRIITVKGKVGMIATAYGLVIANMLKINDFSYMRVRYDIVDTLWKFRLENGGFSAISQTENASIEATVWAVRAFYYVGDIFKFEITLQDLYNLLEQYQLNEESSITTLTLVMDVLCECQPDSEILNQLKDIILDKSYCCDDNSPLYWPISNTEKEKGSSLYTILAVISLLNYAKINDDLEESKDYLHNCGEWILKAKWDNFEEVISRPISIKKEDRLVYQHYTSPWGIIALLKLGYNKKEKRIVDEMKKLLENERNGLWAWNGELNYPIWAIYSSISAICEFALCDFEL